MDTVETSDGRICKQSTIDYGFPVTASAGFALSSDIKESRLQISSREAQAVFSLLTIYGSTVATTRTFENKKPNLRRGDGKRKGGQIDSDSIKKVAFPFT